MLNYIPLDAFNNKYTSIVLIALLCTWPVGLERSTCEKSNCYI